MADLGGRGALAGGMDSAQYLGGRGGMEIYILHWEGLSRNRCIGLV